MNKVFKNAGWIIGCKLVKAILTLIVTIFTARYLGPSNYGLINYAASLVTFITPIMKLGLDSTLVYEIVKKPDSEGMIMGTSIVMCFISAILSLIGIVMFVLFANAGEQDTLIVCILYGLLLLFSAFEMIQYWFQAKLLSKYSAIAMLISYIIITIVQIFCLLTNKNVYWFALSHSLDYFIIAILLIAFYKKRLTQKLVFSKECAKTLLSRSKYYIVSSLMVTIFAQTDRIMLKIMIDNSSVGYYSAAVTCANMFAFVFAAIIDSFRPSIYEAQKKSQKKFEKYMKYLYSIIIYFSLFLSLVMTIFSPLIIKIMYGVQYSDSILALKIIVWYTTFSYLGSVRNVWIVAENKQKILWKINLCGAIMNILLNYITIPKFGIYGAAAASLFTQIFTNVIIGYIFKDIKKNNDIMFQALNPKNLYEIISIVFSNIKNKKIMSKTS